MGQKQVDVAAIQSINASIVSEGTIAFEKGTSADTGIASGDYTPYWVEDDSQEKLGTCLRDIYLNSGAISETVTNYNDYMNSVAEAFQNQDNALAKEIEYQGTESIPTPKNTSGKLTAEEELIIRDSESSAILNSEKVHN